MAQRGRPRKKPDTETVLKNKITELENYISELEETIPKYIHTVIEHESKIKELENKLNAAPKGVHLIHPRKLFEALRKVAHLKLQSITIGKIIEYYEKQF